jgi:hypothetical protein
MEDLRVDGVEGAEVVDVVDVVDSLMEEGYIAEWILDSGTKGKARVAVYQWAVLMRGKGALCPLFWDCLDIRADSIDDDVAFV